MNFQEATTKLDKRQAAEKIRAHLEKRIADVLECKPSELPRMKLGTCLHFLFLLKGASEEIGGFHTSMAALLRLVGQNLTWDIEEEESQESSMADTARVN